MSVPARRDDAPPPVVDVDTLRYLGLDPDRIEVRAMVLLANRYRLDPLLGHVQVIQTRHGNRVYVTRDGMLDIAHRSGQLDGIVVEAERRSSENDGWSAYVSVWRKDCAHPFTYGAQCKDAEPQAKGGNGPEMALARAERRALRRAFNIPVDDYLGDDHVEPGDLPASVSETWDTPSDAASDVPAPADDPAPSGRLDDYPLVGEFLPDRAHWEERARRRGVPPFRVLTRAREVARDLGVTLPQTADEITNPDVVAAVLAWLDEG